MINNKEAELDYKGDMNTIIHDITYAWPTAAAYPLRGSICLEFPHLGRFWGEAYTYWRICETLPLVRRLLGTRDHWWMVVCIEFSFGKPPHGTLPPCHPSYGENTKAWDWIYDDDSDLNDRSHSWMIRTSISSMEKSIVDSGKSEKNPLSLEKQNFLKNVKKGNNANSSSSKWMILHA